MSDAIADRITRMTEFIRRSDKANPSSEAIDPKDAATLILIDRSGAEPKVLLGKRHDRHVFMPGKFVFPGGGVDPSDEHMLVARELDKQAEMRLLQRFPEGSLVRARALALAASPRRAPYADRILP